MTMIAPYPLQWPQGRARLTPDQRKYGRFNRKDRYPGEAWTRTSDISVADALKRLQEELGRIGARFPVVSTNLETRIDGLPRSGAARPNDPGVAVYFQLAGEHHCLPCDTYTEVAHNIAAVAAHIEATRAVERHGVASIREMFSGFAALPPQKKWFEVLGVNERATEAEISSAYRREAARRHPDKPGGSRDLMAELNSARDQAIKEISQ